MRATTIGTQLYSLLKDVAPLYLAEAETDSYPYAVYELTPEPLYTKDGPVGYRSDVPFRIYTKDFDTANAIAAAVVTALEAGMQGAQYYAHLVRTYNECASGIWTITLELIVTEYFVEESETTVEDNN